MSDLLKIIVIGVIVFLVYSNLSPDAQSKITNFLGGVKDKAASMFDNSTTRTQPYQEGNKTILGPVYQEVSCSNDLECQEWYKCSGCKCDSSTGQCWYD